MSASPGGAAAAAPDRLPAGRGSSCLRARARFWIEAVVSVVGAILSAATLVVPDWIEAVFNVDPDQHSGTVELALAGAFLAAAVAAGALARRESRRPRLAAAPVSSRTR